MVTEPVAGEDIVCGSTEAPLADAATHGRRARPRVCDREQVARHVLPIVREVRHLVAEGRGIAQAAAAAPPQTAAPEGESPRPISTALDTQSVARVIGASPPDSNSSDTASSLSGR